MMEEVEEDVEFMQRGEKFRLSRDQVDKKWK